MSKHTPGPWVACTGDHESLRNGSGNSRLFPHVHLGPAQHGWHGWRDQLTVNVGGGPLEEHDANARLIAAAPDLLAALKALLVLADEHGWGGSAWDDGWIDARAAISKAEGES